LEERPKTAWRALVAFAALFVVVYGLQEAADILLPIVLAMFISVASMPVLRLLQRFGVPGPLAVLGIVLVIAGILAGLTGIVAGAVASFTSNIDQYQQPLQKLIEDSLRYAEGYGVPVERTQLLQLLSPDTVVSVLGQTVGAVLAVASRLVIVLVTVSFILLEASEIAAKLSAAFGTAAQPDGPFTGVAGQVQRYLLIKSVVSAVTGLLAGMWCGIFGLEFAVFWGVLAFLANYIPSVGSIAAAVPPVVLAIVQLGLPEALGILVGYVAINVALGNVIEPRLMGRSLGLSPLVVFLSLVFFGWVWGPVGMLFSVPITVIFKLVLEGSEETRWIAVLLGSAREAKEVGDAAS
jgi:predicted PurR-regulated permease PerM